MAPIVSHPAKSGEMCAYIHVKVMLWRKEGVPRELAHPFTAWPEPRPRASRFLAHFLMMLDSVNRGDNPSSFTIMPMAPVPGNRSKRDGDHMVRYLRFYMRSYPHMKHSIVVSHIMWVQVNCMMRIFPHQSQLLYASTVLDDYVTKSANGGCAICISRVNQGKANVQLSCGHVFHQICLAQWMVHRFNCPLCRNAIPGC